ncbi:MAG: metal ABC transporter ATP-binding protein [Pseudomonadota bacterium]
MLQKSEPLVSLKNAGINRADRWLVRGVDLAIDPGEIVTLIGPNGSGKSTTAKMALGILKPDEGNAHRKDGLVVGYVPQKIAIDWTLPLTVERFMHLMGKLPVEEVEKAIVATGVEHLRHEEMQTLSGGEFQRVLLARAVARNPDLLVLDEPVQGVDFAGEIALYELIRDIRDDLNCGVLLISHDLHVVMAATDHVICLNGHVCCSGTPSAVVGNKEYQSLFGPRANPALAVYEHNHDHTHLPDGTVTDHCHPDDGHHDHKQGEDHNHAG